MDLFSRHRFFLRCVSLFTALSFLPASVQAWHFLPAATAYDGGGGVDRDLAGLLEMMASLEAAADPSRPASPWLVAEAATPAPPVPLRPDVPTPPVAEAPASPPLPRATADSRIPLPHAPNTQLAQAEGLAPSLNVAITPEPKGDAAESADQSRNPAPKPGYLPVARAAAPLPEVAAFIERLKGAPEPAPESPVLLAQANGWEGLPGDLSDSEF